VKTRVSHDNGSFGKSEIIGVKELDEQVRKLADNNLVENIEEPNVIL
jgi:hypothetical protein